MNPRVQRSKDFVFSVLGPFLGQNMPIFAGCATLFLLMASFPLLIWVLVIVNHLPGYSITDVADLLYQFLPQVPEIQDVILEVLYGLNTHHLCGVLCRRDDAVLCLQRYVCDPERTAAADSRCPVQAV